jgi:hypothetical protein
LNRSARRQRSGGGSALASPPDASTRPRAVSSVLAAGSAAGCLSALSVARVRSSSSADDALSQHAIRSTSAKKPTTPTQSAASVPTVNVSPLVSQASQIPS